MALASLSPTSDLTDRFDDRDLRGSGFSQNHVKRSCLFSSSFHHSSGGAAAAQLRNDGYAELLFESLNELRQFRTERFFTSSMILVNFSSTISPCFMVDGGDG